MTFAVAQTFEWPIAIIAQKSSLEDWNLMAEKYNVEIKFSSTYHSLPGTGQKNQNSQNMAT